MDSKIVSREIRKIVRPFLKQAGFAHFTGRTAWRFGSRKIDVVNFQSFNAYLAEAVGATTFSFALNLGCYFLSIPSPFKPGTIPEKGGNPLPREYHCHLRRSLQKRFRQPELARPTIWYIDPAGRYLEPAIADAADVLQAEALPWFEALDDLEKVLDLLVNAVEKDAGTWGMGANPSPVRHYYTGFIALALERKSLARKHLKAALDSGLYQNVEARIHNELEKLVGDE